MIARPASLEDRVGASDSPEKAGPTMPTILVSPTACCASAGGLGRVALRVELDQRDLAVGVRRVVLVDRQLGAVLASWMTRPASSPVSAPKKPIFRPQALPPPAVAALVRLTCGGATGDERQRWRRHRAPVRASASRLEPSSIRCVRTDPRRLALAGTDRTDRDRRSGPGRYPTVAGQRKSSASALTEPLRDRDARILRNSDHLQRTVRPRRR